MSAATTVVGGTFLRCDFTDVVLFGCLYVDCRFERCRFWDTDFHGCTFRRTVFVDSELRVSKDLDFFECQFDGAGVAVHDALDDADAALTPNVLDLLEQAGAFRQVRRSGLELRGVWGLGAELEVAWRDRKLAISLMTPAELADRQHGAF